MKPPSALYQTRRGLYAPTRKGYTSTNIFSDPQTAEYVAGTSTSKLPFLNNLPEVIITGRANTGKSSLFNAVLGRTSLLHTSSKPGRTRQLNFYRVGPGGGKLVLVDAPGYGKRGRVEWGQLFEEYILTREQLRRIYVTFNGKHALADSDAQMLQFLSENLISETGMQRYAIQAVITKADEVLVRDVAGLRKAIWEAAPMCLPPIVTSARIMPPFGVDELRKNIVEACQV